MTETPASNEILRTERLCKNYPDGDVKALVDVTVSIHRGDYIAVTGPSGCGKSTLLNLLGGLDHPTSGQVFFENQELSQLENLDAYRRLNLGFVFQSFHLMSTLRAVENVQIPMFCGKLSIPERVEKASELLRLVGLGHRLWHRPEQLSVGERQRVAIARALANDPQVLLGDEPTGNLDSRSAGGVLDLFDELLAQRDLTLVLVTHSDVLTSRAARVLQLEDGRLLSDSQPS